MLCSVWFCWLCPRRKQLSLELNPVDHRISYSKLVTSQYRWSSWHSLRGKEPDELSLHCHGEGDQKEESVHTTPMVLPHPCFCLKLPGHKKQVAALCENFLQFPGSKTRSKEIRSLQSLQLTRYQHVWTPWPCRIWSKYVVPASITNGARNSKHWDHACLATASERRPHSANLSITACTWAVISSLL